MKTSNSTIALYLALFLSQEERIILKKELSVLLTDRDLPGIFPMLEIIRKGVNQYDE